jgi:hypothetical protein
VKNIYCSVIASTLLITSIAIAGNEKAPSATPTSITAQPKPVPQTAMPQPSNDLLEYAADLVGTWKCAGKVSMDGKTTSDAKAKVTNKLALDKWWMQTSYDGTIGKMKFTFVTYTTYNQVEKKFTRAMFDNMGASSTDTAIAIDHGMAGKWGITWVGENTSGAAMAGMPTKVKMRHNESISGQGKLLNMRGETTVDGTNWIEIYSLTCKR